MKPFEEKVSSAEQEEEEAARKEADTLENLDSHQGKGLWNGCGAGLCRRPKQCFCFGRGKGGKRRAAYLCACGAVGKNAGSGNKRRRTRKERVRRTAAAKALRHQAEKQVDKEIYTIDIQNDAKREEIHAERPRSGQQAEKGA